jgi:site-specific recombinase XerD
MLNQIAQQSKGAKDRDIPLYSICLEQLRRYYKAYKPSMHLIEGQKGGQYSESSIRSVLKRALNKSGINKKIKVHYLRYANATYMLQNGTDIRIIAENQMKERAFHVNSMQKAANIFFLLQIS